jgi:hypothetical protein
MNAQMVKRLAGVLAALVVVWLGMSLVRRSRRDSAGRLALTRFDPATADQALIVRGTDTLRFVRQGGAWDVNGHPADATLVGKMLQALADTAAQSELVAQNASSFRALGLDSGDAQRVSVLRGGRTVAQLLLGGAGGTFGSVYVRKPGQSASYRLKGSLADLVYRRPDDWRDKVIAKVAPDSVSAVEVRRGRREYTLTRAAAEWRLGQGAADSAAVTALLNRFRDVEAAGFPTAAQADSVSFAHPARTVRLLAEAGRPLLVLSMDSTATGFWVRREGDADIYRMDTWTANTLTPVDSTFRKKPARAAATPPPPKRGR